MRPWMILLNNFCHDLFTGMWFGSFITLWVLEDKMAEIGEQAQWLSELSVFFFYLCIFSLVTVSLTGLFRYLYYKNWNEGKKESPQLKKQMLIVKHAVFGTSFLGGSILSYLWVF